MSDIDRAELAGRVIMITGASRGLGRAVAVACAAAGATTLVCGRDVAALEALTDELESRGDPLPVIVPINLEAASVDDFLSITAHIKEQFGCLDGLVVNAAVVGELAPLETYDPMIWARVFQVNVHSVFLLLQSCLPLLAEADDASIVFSLAEEGDRGRAHWGAYAATKSALKSLMEILADEHETNPGLRVHGVIPSPLRTRLRMTAFPAQDPAAFAPPETAAGTYVELLGARGRGRHGVVIKTPRRD